MLQDAAGPEVPELPAELWAKIFRKMSVKEWARAAGTARALWAASPYPPSTLLVSYRGSYRPGWGGATLDITDSSIGPACAPIIMVFAHAHMVLLSAL